VTVEVRDVAPVPETRLEPVNPGDELPGGLQALYDGRGRMETFEHVLVSHGEPVHTRADFEAALERRPWGF
jgi:hypothetical protein